MMGKWSLLLSGLGMALAAPASAQRQLLPYGLRAGRHVVAARADGGWHPAAPASAPTLVLLVTDGQPVGPDSATAVYLASHGYIVMYGAAESPDARASARIELHPAGALVRITVAGQRVTVAMPPGTSDWVRLRAAITYAVVAAGLRPAPLAVADIVRRLRTAGLTVSLVPDPR
jgi:hypothetical protein